MMRWFHQHKRFWRAALLILLLVALIGPWGFEEINVPAIFPCEDPFIRLEGDFCGMPIPGISMLLGGLVLAPIELGVWLFTGGYSTYGPVAAFNILLYFLLVLLILLPIFSTLLLVLRGDRQRQPVVHIAVLGLAAGSTLLLGMFYLSTHIWSSALWGIWFYIGLAAVGLIPEMLTLAAGRRPGPTG